MENVKKELRSISNRLSELDKVNDKVEEINVAFKQTLDTRLALEVAKNVEKQTMNFSEIVERQLEEEVLKNIGINVKNEVSESPGKVSDNIEQVQIKVEESRI